MTKNLGLRIYHEYQKLSDYSFVSFDRKPNMKSSCKLRILIKLLHLSLTFAAHYLSIHKQNGVVLPSEDSQSIDARSRVECILKCRTHNKKNGIYTEEYLCFCSNGNLESSDNGGRIGKAYHEVGIS